MRLSGEAYSKRLDGYSTSTLLLISEIMGLSKEVVLKSADITTNSELSEEEVVEKLKELLESSSRS